MFKFKSATGQNNKKQNKKQQNNKLVTVESMMNSIDEIETTQQTEKILESRSSHWIRSKDTHGYQFRGGAFKGQKGQPEKLSQPSSPSSQADSSSQDHIQAELEELVSGLNSRNSVVHSKGAKAAPA